MIKDGRTSDIVSRRHVLARPCVSQALNYAEFFWSLQAISDSMVHRCDPIDVAMYDDHYVHLRTLSPLR